MKRVDADKEVPILINKMLEKHGVDYDYVVKNQHIDGVPWYRHFTWNVSEEDEYSKWFVERFKKVHKYPVKLAKRELAYFLLQWGLYCTDRFKDD